MTPRYPIVILCIAALITKAAPGAAEQKRPIVPADCVTVRYLHSGNSTHPRPISLSPDGRRFAYLLKVPNLATNENDIELHVRGISDDPTDKDRLILTGNLESMQWLGDGKHIMILARKGSKREVEEVDIENGNHWTLVNVAEDITEYRADASGSLIVFAVAESESARVQAVSANDLASGYRIPFKREGHTAWPQRKMFITRRGEDGWTTPTPIRIESPFTHQALSVLTTGETLWMSLSPDGKRLLIQYYDTASSLPERWEKDGYVSYMKSIGFVPGTSVLVLYRTDTGNTTVPFETPFATTMGFWSSDSSAFAIFAKPPVDSVWAKRDAEKGPAVVNHAHQAHLFWVQADTGKVELIATHEQAEYAFGQPLYWGEDGVLLVADLTGRVNQFIHQEDHWVEGYSFVIPIQGSERLISDGHFVVGEMQSAANPPALFRYGLGDTKVQVLEELNPQFDGLALAHVKDVSWKTSAGRNVKGTLFLPPDYEPGRRYPLVIQTKPYDNWFVCDQGEGHFPSFIPQPLASAGIAYLGFYYPDDHDGKGLESFYPKGYPGNIAEAAFETDVYDTAVESLAAEGFVDPNDVGIVGFSSSGWFTEFALMFGKTHYKAATAVDNVNYSFTEFALSPLIGLDPQTDSSTYGGPPSGSTLKNWIDYSISFNLDKIHTPLLMEEMGYGNQFDRRYSPPIFIAEPFETFGGLNLLHKPVELYYYPNEEHQPDHPKARLANLQRNLDWYRFWLQGYERHNPEDPDQYKRWEGLRKLQETENTGSRFFHCDPPGAQSKSHMSLRTVTGTEPEPE